MNWEENLLILWPPKEHQMGNSEKAQSRLGGDIPTYRCGQFRAVSTVRGQDMSTRDLILGVLGSLHVSLAV